MSTMRYQLETDTVIVDAARGGHSKQRAAIRRARTFAREARRDVYVYRMDLGSNYKEHVATAHPNGRVTEVHQP